MMRQVPRARSLRTLLAFPLLALLAIGVLASPAAAATYDADDSLVVLTGRAVVAGDERIDNVVIFDGDAVVTGRVDNDVVAFNGDVRVSGRVGGDVIALNGRAVVAGRAAVAGDVRSSDRPLVMRRASVGGEIERVNVRAFLRATRWFGFIAWWIAATVSLLALGALFLGLFPRAAAAATDAGTTQVGPTIGWGLLVGLVLPVAAVALLFTLVGIPLAIGVLLAFALLFPLGYVTSARCLGRAVGLRTSRPFMQFLGGLAILRAVAIVPFLGGLVALAACVYGAGALTVAAWRAGRPVPQTVPVAAAPPSPATPSPAPSA
jgi:hypothetical protein